jgi:DNA-binding NarL/FixJ family response regulator
MAIPTGETAREPHRRVRILLADDHEGIRKVVRSVLEKHPRFEVIGEAMDGKIAIEKATKLKPDVVVLNVAMPVLNGLEAARAIRANVPESAIVILSSSADERYIAAAQEIGARAYVAKTKAGDALVQAIEEAIAGGDFVLVK